MGECNLNKYIDLPATYIEHFFYEHDIFPSFHHILSPHHMHKIFGFFLERSKFLLCILYIYRWFFLARFRLLTFQQVEIKIINCKLVLVTFYDVEWNYNILFGFRFQITIRFFCGKILPQVKIVCPKNERNSGWLVFFRSSMIGIGKTNGLTIHSITKLENRKYGHLNNVFMCVIYRFQTKQNEM